jgi:hypothetical protein
MSLCHQAHPTAWTEHTTISVSGAPGAHVVTQLGLLLKPVARNLPEIIEVKASDFN